MTIFTGSGSTVKIDQQIVTITPNAIGDRMIMGRDPREIVTHEITHLSFKEANLATVGIIRIGDHRGATDIRFAKKHTAEARAVYEQLVAAAPSDAVNSPKPPLYSTGQQKAQTANNERTVELLSNREEQWADTKFLLNSPGDKLMGILARHVDRGTAPLFVICLANQLLAALPDRLVLAKTGAHLTGKWGGQIDTTFYYRDITAIEFNTGAILGTIEIITPGHQSTRPGAKPDPNHTFSIGRAVYDGIAEHINGLRKLISEAKAPAAASMGPAAASLGDELAKLLALRDAGALSDEEFTQAKATLLSQ